MPTEQEIMRKIDYYSRMAAEAMSSSTIVIDVLIRTHKEEKVPRGYSRSEEDLAVYGKCQKLLCLIADGVFSEDGLSSESQKTLEAVLSCIK